MNYIIRMFILVLHNFYVTVKVISKKLNKLMLNLLKISPQIEGCFHIINVRHVRGIS